MVDKDYEGALKYDLFNGASRIKRILGRNIIVSEAIGKVNLLELQWLAENIIRIAYENKIDNWVYIAIINYMLPVTMAEGAFLANARLLYKSAGCSEIIFVDGYTNMLKEQAKSHQRQAKIDINEIHLETLEQAMEYCEKKGI